MENWKWIEGFENIYDVSDHGRVGSYYNPNRKGGLVATRQIMKPVLDYTKRYKVNLYLNGKKKTKFIHNLVASAFIGNKPEGLVICHGNGDALDNRLENLRYDTPKANMADCIAHGTFVNGKKKLTPDEVLQIVQQCQSGKSQRFVADDFGVTRTCVNHIMNGRSWKSLTGLGV